MANAYQPDFTSLIAEVQDICEDTNAEFVSNIPNFIHRGQDNVQRDLSLDLWRQYLLTSISGVSLPRDTGWLIVRSLYLPNQNKWLEKRHLDYVRMYGGEGRPKVWAEDQEATLLVGPKPNGTYPVRVEFYQRLDPLSADNPTNWITRNAGDLLLLQTLINAQSYLVSPERVQEFTGMYAQVQQSALSELRESERQRYEPVRSAPRPSPQPGGG